MTGSLRRNEVCVCPRQHRSTFGAFVASCQSADDARFGGGNRAGAGFLSFPRAIAQCTPLLETAAVRSVSGVFANPSRIHEDVIGLLRAHATISKALRLALALHS